MSAPKPPVFDPTAFLNGISDKVEQNFLQMIIILGICALVVGYLLYMIWEEYHKHPIKFKHHKMGKGGFKLSDVLRKK